MRFCSIGDSLSILLSTGSSLSASCALRDLVALGMCQPLLLRWADGHTGCRSSLGVASSNVLLVAGVTLALIAEVHSHLCLRAAHSDGRLGLILHEHPREGDTLIELVMACRL